MKISKGMIALVSGLALASSLARAEDAPATAAAPAASPATSAEKKSGIQTVLPGAYAKLEVRHSAFRFEKGDEIAKDRINLAARPSLGSTLFDGKVDTSFTWIFQRDNSQGQGKRTDLYNDTFVTLADAGKGGVVSIESTSYSGTKGHFYDNDTSLNYESPTTWELPAGGNMLGLYVLNMLGTSFTPDADTPQRTVKRVSDKRGSEFGLTGTDESKTKQRSPGAWDLLYTSVYIKPGIVDGLKLSVGTELDTVWDPKYTEQVGSDDSHSVSQDGYKVSKLTINKFGVSYKINDKVTVVNQLRQYENGFWAQSLNVDTPDAPLGVNYRWENRLIMTATLF